MKISAVFLAAVFAEERTIPPTTRLANIHDGLVDWCHEWIPDYKKKIKLDSKLANLVFRMDDMFTWDCAKHSISDAEYAELEIVS